MLYNILTTSFVLTTLASTAAAATHSIQVGANDTLTFSPANITASVGDTVEFIFNPKNHTVTQSNFANPCETLEQSNSTAGFDSGFTHNTTVNATSTTAAGFSFTVNDTKPIWGYCAQTNPISHCGSGMVFSVNAPTTGNNTFAAFLALAKATNTNSSSNATSSGTASGSATATGSGAESSSTGSSAISTSINVGMTAVLAVFGVVLSAL